METELLNQLDENTLTSTERRKRILGFEEMLAQTPGAFFGDTDNCPLKHDFAEGCYIRQITIPKGTIVVGKIHKHCHPSFILSGDVSVFTEQEGVVRIKAPHSFVSPAGVKRVVYANEDTVWTTVHVTPETDLEKIEDYVIAKSFDELELDMSIIKKLKE